MAITSATRGAEARGSSSHRQLDAVGDVARERDRTVADGVGDVTGAPGCGVDGKEQERECDGSRDNCGGELRSRSAVPEAQDEHQVRGGEHDDAAAVGAEAGAADGDERQGADGDSGASEQRRADERRHEQHRLEQVVDPVEPP